jgi:hypothetical protein
MNEREFWTWRRLFIAQAITAAVAAVVGINAALHHWWWQVVLNGCTLAWLCGLMVHNRRCVKRYGAR